MDTLIALLLPLLRIIAVWCASVVALAFAAAMTPGAFIRTVELHLIFGTIFLIPGLIAAMIDGAKRDQINPDEDVEARDQMWTIVFVGLLGLKGVMGLVIGVVFYLVGGFGKFWDGKSASIYAANPISALVVGLLYVFFFCVLYLLIQSFYHAFTEGDDA